MRRQLSNNIYGLKFAMEKNDFERLKSSSRKKQNDFVANPIYCAGRVLKPGFREISEGLRGKLPLNCELIFQK